MQAKKQNNEDKCRLDKWLWAARFFKTRSLAIIAIETGKIHVNGERVKPAKEVQLQQTIHIRNKDFEVEISIIGISNVRRDATHAALLYYETEDSKAKRENLKVNTINTYANREKGAGRPTKQQQRQIAKFIKGYLL